MIKRFKSLLNQKSIRAFGKFILTFGLYILLGEIGSQITISPGKFAIFWVLSGFALGIILIFRRPAIFAVLFATLVVNLLTFSSNESLILLTLISLLISLQAILTSELIRKNVSLTPPEDVKDTIRVIIIIFFTSIVTSIIGTLLLFLWHIDIPVSYWIFAALWFIGSTISNFAITPVLLLLFHHLRVRKRRALFVSIFSFFIISFTFLLVYITWISETERSTAEFEEDSREIFSVITSEFQKEIESIQGINALFTSSNFVERNEFSNFTKIYLKNSDSTISLSWVPIVQENQLYSFEKQVQNEGFTDYKVFELNSALEKIRVNKRKVYYPVNYFASENESENIMGFDFGSSLSLLDAIDKASEIGKPILTEPLNLHLTPTDKEDIYVIVPVYGKTEEFQNLPELKENIVGYGVGNFDIDNSIKTALSTIKNHDINTFLFDITDSHKEVFISYYPHSENSNELFREIQNKQNTFEQEFEIFGRTWKLISLPGSYYSINNFPNYSLMVLVIGITLLIAYLVNSYNREKSEKRIQKSESMFRSLSDSALTGIVRFRQSGEILYANDALAKIFGFDSLRDINKFNFLELFENPQEVRNILTSFSSGYSLLNKQFKVKNLKAKTRDILVSAGFYEDLVSANIVDITDLNKLNKEISQLNHAIRYMADTLFITNSKGIIEYVNPAFELLTGFSYGESVGKHIKQIKQYINGDDHSPFNWDAILDNNAHEFEFQTKLNDLENITELISITPIYDSEGNLIQYIGSGKDITDLKKAREEILNLNSSLEKRVIQRTSELEKAKKEMEAFSYSVSHDLRAPLRIINGYLSILLEDYANEIDSTAATYLSHIKEASIKMDNLIQEILKLSRITNSPCVRKKVDLVKISREIFQSLQSEEPDRCVILVVPEELVVWADPDLIHIALDNLIRNAWKFSKNTEKAIIELGSFLDGDEQVFYIKDNGAGFDMALEEKLFGVFQRLHTDAEFEGTGIGLATVKRIINHHEGKIWAVGEVGKGATFFFTIENIEEKSNQ